MTDARHITAYHGGHGSIRDARWFTTDRTHAANFGPVSEVQIDTSCAAFIDADMDERLADLDGWEADDALYQIMKTEGLTVLMVENYEGDGYCVLVDSFCCDELVMEMNLF